MMMNRAHEASARCVLCENTILRADRLQSGAGTYRLMSRIECRTCGIYLVTDTLRDPLTAGNLSTWPEVDRFKLSSITRIATERREPPVELSTDSVDRLLKGFQRPSRTAQVDMILEYIERHMGEMRVPVPIDLGRDYPIAFANGRADFEELSDVGRDKGYLTWEFTPGDGRKYKLAFDGDQRLETLRKDTRTGTTGWPKVDRQIDEARRQLQGASVEEQFQAVGLHCREVLISVGQVVYVSERHGVLEDGTEIGPTDAKRMLEAFFQKELEGSSNAQARKHARAAVDLALGLQHQRTATRRQALMALDGAVFVASLAATVAGKRDA